MIGESIAENRWYHVAVLRDERKWRWLRHVKFWILVWGAAESLGHLLPAFACWQKKESRQLLDLSSPSDDPSMLCCMKYIEIIGGGGQSRCISQVCSQRGSFANSWRAELQFQAGSFQGTSHMVPATVVGRQVSELVPAVKLLYCTPTCLTPAGIPRLCRIINQRTFYISDFAFT